MHPFISFVVSLSFALVFCVMAYVNIAILTWLLRGILMFLRQAFVIISSQKHHVSLLMQLWGQEVLCRRYRDNLALEVVGKQGKNRLLWLAYEAEAYADQLIESCRQAGISRFKINSFKITTYDYCWWTLLRFW